MVTNPPASPSNPNHRPRAGAPRRAYRRPVAAATANAPRRQRAEAHVDKLVLLARAGDDRAWQQLVARFDRILRNIARSYRLSPSDVDDAVQGTWTRLYQNIDRVRDPGAISAWLMTTTRRESMRLLQSHMRLQLSDDPELGDAPDDIRPEAGLLAAEERGVLDRALATLPGRQRELMTLLSTEPDVDYQGISDKLVMPLGSIGPIRARGLARLGRNAELRSHYFNTH
jgi:RNA polymerase sigma factor (sigma-70 family)